LLADLILVTIVEAEGTLREFLVDVPTHLAGVCVLDLDLATTSIIAILFDKSQDLLSNPFLHRGLRLVQGEAWSKVVTNALEDDRADLLKDL